MTARTKVTLVEATQIRRYLIGCGISPYEAANESIVDELMEQGLIDVDAVLRRVEQP